MKNKSLKMCVFVTFLSLVFLFNYVSADSLIAERLKGRILLQVQDNGEAYYICPNNSYSYYLGRPQDAFDIMRALGLGITNADLNKIPRDSDNWDGEAGLIERLKGRILLQTEENGEAWYIYPVNGKRYYLGRPADAFQIMRNLGLGITNQDLNTIQKSTIKIDENGSIIVESNNTNDNTNDSTSNNTNNNQTNTNNYSCGSNLYNCTDFSTQSEAQTIYNKCMQEVGKDIHKLDRDNNGIACESN